MKAARVKESVSQIARTIDAPVQEVFRAWTDASLLERWLTDQAQIDPQVGGRFRFAPESIPDKPGLHVTSGQFREIVPDHRLVMTWIYNGPNPEDLGESLVSVEFVATGSSTTELNFREEGQALETEEERAFSRDTWSRAFDALERALMK
jgi:uncharacterized protein YndB with AHSA1/START domain